MDWELDPTLRAILVCPACKAALSDVKRGLLCLECKRIYPVVDNVPMMLEELSKPATLEELSAHEI